MKSYLDLLGHLDTGTTIQEACKTEYIQENFLNGNSKEVDAIVKEFKEEFKPIYKKLLEKFKAKSFKQRLTMAKSTGKRIEIDTIVDFLKKKSCKILAISSITTVNGYGNEISINYYPIVIYKDYVIKFNFKGSQSGVVSFISGAEKYNPNTCNVPKDIMMYILQEIGSYFKDIYKVKKNNIHINIKDIDSKGSQMTNIITRITKKYPNITAKPKFVSVSFTINNE